MIHTIKACIFDLDGVIVDTARYHYLSWKSLFKTMGFDFKEQDNEPLKGASRMHSLEIILDLAGLEKTMSEKDALCRKKNEIYLASIEEMTRNEILPGVAHLIETIQAHDISISLGSASRNARHILDLLEITNRFDAIVDGNDVHRGKPDPEVFLLASEKLGVPPHQCLVIEDAAKGIQAARNAGMLAVGIGDLANLDRADLVLPNLKNMTWTGLLKKLKSSMVS
ncbi:MAG: beta-phosphoglucomutase [Saprospiraceae bacterium]|nr:beta-phosphoglucomutase [Saprospiraceae bacterium]